MSRNVFANNSMNPAGLAPLSQLTDVLVPSLRWHANGGTFRSRKADGDSPIGVVCERPAKMLVVVPAHNEAETITDTLDHIVSQSRMPEKIVVVADNCTDDTAAIVLRYARKHKPVQLMTTRNNRERKVGALNQAWLTHSQGFDLVACIDADTVLWQDALAELEEELVPRTRCAGVMAKYTFDQDWVPPMVEAESKAPARKGQTKSLRPAKLPWRTRQLVRAQRHEFTSWNLDQLRRQRQTYVLGGQATLFRQEALIAAAYINNGYGPWNTHTDVEDMELTWRFQDMKLETLVSSTARADAGAMYNIGSFWAQRRKWDEGMIRLLLRYGLSRKTLYPWMQQIKMGLDLVVRLLFLVMLTVSLSMHSFVWSWYWLIPPVIAILVNLKVALKMPRRRWSDCLFALLYFPAEIYLWLRLASFVASWGTALSGGTGKDNWAVQAKAERGGGNGASTAAAVLLGLLCALLMASVIGASLAPRAIADAAIASGWLLMKTLTITLTVLMAMKLLVMTVRDRVHEA